ncbi:MAG: DUF86 domain-containing protein [Deltaproteobacteria bacterium]|nr:DUF86 domain-containing protein [Deltaproteobacteria bacterium]
MVNSLSDEFKLKTKEVIPWRDIISMRNKFVHGYLDMDLRLIWETVVRDIPVLHKFCVEKLKNLQPPVDKNNSSATSSTPSTPKYKP